MSTCSILDLLKYSDSMLPSIQNFSGVLSFVQSDVTIKSKMPPATGNLIGSAKLVRSTVLLYMGWWSSLEGCFPYFWGVRGWEWRKGGLLFYWARERTWGRFRVRGSLGEGFLVMLLVGYLALGWVGGRSRVVSSQGDFNYRGRSRRPPGSVWQGGSRWPPFPSAEIRGERACQDFFGLVLWQSREMLVERQILWRCNFPFT